MKHGDNILARISAKSQLNLWRVLAVVALVALIVISLETVFGGKSSTMARKAGSDYIARVSVMDFVYDNPEFGELLKDIEEDDKAKALIVWIDTPGGSAVGGEEIYYQLRDVAKKKPVVAVMRSIATSAGYLVALGTDHIVAREGTITGSIGVMLQTAEITDLAEKIGVTPITIKSSPLKGSPGLFEKASPAAIESLKTMLDGFYHTFVRMTAERRPFSLEQAYELADGRVYSGSQALKYQMIDAIGGEQEALNWLEDKKNVDISLHIVDVDAKTEAEELLSRLAETVSQKFSLIGGSSLDGIRAIWHPSIQ